MLRWAFIIIGLFFIVRGVYGIWEGNEGRTNVASFMLSALSFVLSFVLPYSSTDNPTGPSPVPTSTATIEEVQGEDEEESGASDIDENQEDKNIFTGNEWTGELGEEESNEVCYKPVQSGNYRFDFVINDVNTSYRFLIKNSANEEIVNAYSGDEGVTTELEAGQLYTLFVEQYEGDVKYCIKIGVPQEIKNVENEEISGDLEYTDQIDEYTYTAERTGVYRFDLEIDNVDESYRVVVFDSKKQEELNKYSSDEGGTVELEENEKYTIQVIQEEGMPTYSINIGVPNVITTIEKNNIVGSIKFVDQQDEYIYKAPRTGTYRFDYNIDDVNDDYRVIIKDKKNDVIKENYCSDGGCTVELKGKKTYYVYVKHATGSAKYKIKIHLPKKIITTQNSNVSGKISFIDQENIIYYSVLKTGKYRFEFHTNNAKSDYRIILYEWNNENIFDTYYSNEYKEVELKKGKKYKLYVKYSSGFANYSINIQLI